MTPVFLFVMAVCVALRIHAYGLRRIHEQSAVVMLGHLLVHLGETQKIDRKYAVIHLGISLYAVGSLEVARRRRERSVTRAMRDLN